HEQCRPDVVHKIVAQGKYFCAPSVVVLWILLSETLGDGVEFSLRLRNCDSPLKSRNDQVVVLAPYRTFLVRPPQRRPELGGEIRKLEFLGHDTCHQVALIVEIDLLTHDVRIRPEMTLPKAITEQHNVIMTGPVFVRPEIATKYGLRLQHGQEVGRYSSAGDRFRVRATCQVESSKTVDRRAIEDVILVLPVQVICGGNRKQRNSWEALCRGNVPDSNQPIGTRERKRAEQHRIDHAEDRGVSADAKRQY